MQHVKDLMTRGVRSMSPQDTVLLAAQTMEELNVGALPIVEDARVMGVVTDRDIVLRGVALELPMATTTLSEVMTEQVECVFEDEALEEVIAKMQASQIRRLPVLDDARRLVGMLSLGDLATKADPEAAGFTLAEISEPARPGRAGASPASGGASNLTPTDG
jgi:CBS domain-containing protein